MTHQKNPAFGVFQYFDFELLNQSIRMPFEFIRILNLSLNLLNQLIYKTKYCFLTLDIVVQRTNFLLDRVAKPDDMNFFIFKK